MPAVPAIAIWTRDPHSRRTPAGGERWSSAVGSVIYFPTLPAAVRRADELGLSPTHWQRPDGLPVKIAGPRRSQP